MWQQHSPSFLQFSQFIYGVGTILGPLIVGPYLSGEVDFKEKVTTSNGTVINVLNDTEIIAHQVLRREKLKFPYLIGGLLQCIGKFKILLIIKLQNKRYLMYFKCCSLLETCVQLKCHSIYSILNNLLLN